MMPDRVQALIARCLTDPAFLIRAQERCTQLGDAKLQNAEDEAAALLGATELDRLLYFRGFITKVKHNGLRRQIPNTLCLMGELGFELSFFKTFSPSYVSARAEGPLAINEHLELFSNALISFLNDVLEKYRNVTIETLDHERTLYQLTQEKPEVPQQDIGGIVRWCGTLQIARKHFDIIQLCAALSERKFKENCNIIERDHFLAYWSANDRPGVKVFEMDSLTALLFSMLKQETSFERIAKKLVANGFPELTAAEIKDFVFEASENGFIEIIN